MRLNQNVKHSHIRDFTCVVFSQCLFFNFQIFVQEYKLIDMVSSQDTSLCIYYVSCRGENSLCRDTCSRNA